MKDANTYYADLYEAEEIRRQKLIEEQVEEYLASPEDIAFMLANEPERRFERLAICLKFLLNKKQENIDGLTPTELQIVYAVENFAIQMAQEAI